jgi:hypothetical protein
VSVSISPSADSHKALRAVARRAGREDCESIGEVNTTPFLPNAVNVGCNYTQAP